MSRKRSKVKTNALYESLQKEGFIQYGSTIPGHILMKLTGIDNPDSLDYKGKIINLRLFMEKKGFFSIHRGNGIYIFKAEENAERYLHLENKRKDRQKMQVECLINTVLDDFTKEAQEKYLHAVNVATQVRQSMNSILNKF